MSTHKLHDNETHIDTDLVKNLICTQFSKWHNLPIKELKSAGTDNAIYRLGQDKVIRLPRIEAAVSNIDKEYKWLPLLAPHLPLAIPKPLAKGKADKTYPWPWSVYEWLDGENAATNSIIDLHQAAIDLGGFIAALHKIDSTNGPLSNRGLPLASRDEETRVAIKSLHNQFDTKVLNLLWTSALQELPWQGLPVWIHGDLHASNLLIQKDRLSAVIDFGITGVGDPASDLMVAWTMLTAETRKIFREVVQVDDATWARGRGWALHFGIVALPYYEVTNPILAASARRAIEEVLIDFNLRKNA